MPPRPVPAIDRTAEIAPTATLAPGVVIGPEARIGEHVRLAPGVVIGASVRDRRTAPRSAPTSSSMTARGSRRLPDPGWRGASASSRRSPRTSSLRSSAPLPPLVLGREVTVGAAAVLFAGAAIGDEAIIGDQAYVRERRRGRRGLRDRAPAPASTRGHDRPALVRIQSQVYVTAGRWSRTTCSSAVRDDDERRCGRSPSARRGCCEGRGSSAVPASAATSRSRPAWVVGAEGRSSAPARSFHEGLCPRDTRPTACRHAWSARCRPSSWCRPPSSANSAPAPAPR